MNDIGELIRRVSRQGSRGIPEGDAQPTLPAREQAKYDVPLTERQANPETRRRLWDVSSAMSNVFMDIRQLIPSAGANMWGRILRWLELAGFTESCDYIVPEDGIVKVDPRKANNTIIVANAELEIRMPNGFAESADNAALVERSEIDQAMYGDFDRARIQPHTLWIQHNGFKVGTMPGVRIGEGEQLPIDTKGITVITLAHLVFPGEFPYWYLLGVKHFA